MKSKLSFLNYKVEVFQLMWSLYVGPNFISEIFYSTLIFSIFSPKFCFKILCLISFSNISSKICPSYFLFFYKFDHMSFFTHFYTNPLYLNLFVQINRYGLFLCVYILYIFYTNYITFDLA